MVPHNMSELTLISTRLSHHLLGYEQPIVVVIDAYQFYSELQSWILTKINI